MRPALALVVSFIVAFAAAALGGVASMRARELYAQLDRPAWAPAGWLFGPVWTTLYAMMAVAAWLVWREGRTRGGSAGALALYVVQLLLNSSWTWLFFAWRLGAWATIEIAILWLAIVATIAAFWRLRPLAGALLLPYLGWVTFAAALTWSVWRRNPALL